MRSIRLLALCLAATTLALPQGARAAGPLIVNGAGTPLVWTVNPVPFNPDQGTLGSLNNAAATAAVTSNFGIWTAVATSTISFANAGAMPADVTAANVATYLGVCGDGLSPIIFDTDGSITDAVFGPGASDSVLGFAGPDCGTYVPPVITEGVAALNGKWIDGAGPTEIPVSDFNAVFIHEFGHYFNLDHSQINLVEAFDFDSGNDDTLATMFPFLVNGAETSTLNLDDEVSVSTLYPEASFATGFGTITGSVFLSDGTTPFQGAYVIARKVGDPRLTAVGVASGARYFPANPGGPLPAALRGLYELRGLPPGSYTVEIEEIDGAFTGGSSVGPVDPPATLPGPPEFYNGANEAGTNPPDDPADSVTVAVVAAGTQSGIGIDINGAAPPGNDDCAAPTVIPAVPYTNTTDTTLATTDVSDPLQSCTFDGPAQNSNSVWYVFTAGAAMTLVADTFGSDYDTVLTAHSGSCGALTEIACNDDAVGFQSEITFGVSAGQTVLFEITDFGTPGGVTLVFNVSSNAVPTVTPTPTPKPSPTCGAGPVAGCRTPAVGAKALLAFKDKSPLTDESLMQWKWIKGAATAKADFGNPVVSDTYTLCVYDSTNALISSAAAPVGGLCNVSSPKPCWSENANGFTYGDKDLTPDGIQKILLKQGLLDGQAKIILKAKGVNLAMPAIPIAQPITVQLLNSSGVCWEAEYNAPALKNTAGPPPQFKDKAD